jgi:hypothetical protein
MTNDRQLDYLSTNLAKMAHDLDFTIVVYHTLTTKEKQEVVEISQKLHTLLSRLAVILWRKTSTQETSCTSTSRRRGLLGRLDRQEYFVSIPKPTS